MPHSYGASLAALGRRGARRREAMKLSAPNRMASAISMTTGRYWAKRSPPCDIGRDATVARVEHPAQHAEDDRGADPDHRRVLAAFAEVSDHHDVHVLLGVVNDRRP